MPDLPKSVKVGYRDFTVEDWLKPSIEHCGECDKNYAHIKVDTRFGAASSANTLLHEVFHAMWREADLPTDIEEKAVTLMANQLCGVWRDNPEFVAFMSRSLAGE